MADLNLPVLRNDGTVEENLNENAINDVLPSRYTRKGEESTEVFERVAKNIALAELVHVEDDLMVPTEVVKPSHPRRQELLDDIGVTAGDEFEVTERTAKHLSFDETVNELEEQGHLEYAEGLVEIKEDFQDAMESLSFMPNSPTLMNAGDELQQLSACFVISPDDDINDIHDTERKAAKVFQSGGGMGYGFWKLRPRGAEVGSTGGYASGPITFMRTFDQMCETIAQGGARRGAQMGVMKVDHPDVIEFIHAKRKDVSLAETLRLNDPDDFTHNSFVDALEEARDILDDPPLPNYLRNAIEGHLSNFNISVGVTDDFMEAVENDSMFTLEDPQTGEPWVANEETVELYEMFDLGEYVEEGEVLELPATELWEHMLEGAHENGEPGVVHIDEFNREHSFPVDLDEPLQNQPHAQLATNPCGEQPLMEGEACNLGHINLSTIVSEDLHDWQEFQNLPKYEGKSLEQQVTAFLDTAINWSEFNHRIRLGTQFLDNVVTMSNFPVPEIEETVRDNRKIGIGIMGLAQMYIQLGVPYGSDEANNIAEQLMTHINHKSKERSHELAQQRGSFENWEDSKYANPEEHSEWFESHVGFEPHGEFQIRNHNTTTIAPTGTTSMIGNTSGGCEPIYSVANFKNVSDDVQGEEMMVQFDSLFLRILEANNIDVESVKEEATRLMENNEFRGIESLTDVPDELGDLFVTTSDLSATEHARVQLACQKGVDSAISKTVNAPHEATLDDTREAFELVLQNGGKGVTYYRDGTRSKQVLTTRADNQDVEDDEDEPESKTTIEIVRKKIESDGLESVLEQIGHDGHTLTQIGDTGQTGSSEPSVSSGTRERPNTLVGQTYRIETGYGRMYVTVNDHEERPFEVLATIGKSGGRMESMLEGLARMVSAALRSGIPVEEVIDQLRGIRAPDIGFDNGEQIQSIPDGIATALVRHTGKKPWLEQQEAEPLPKNIERPDGGEVEVEQQTSSGEPCHNCEKGTLIYVEGCKECDTCNWQKC